MLKFPFVWMNEWTDTSLQCRHWRMCFERLLQAFARWQPGNLFDIAAQPILEYRELIFIHNYPCEHSSKLQLSIRFTPSRCLEVWQDWYPIYYPEGMKARVSPVQSIEPHRILAPTRDLNREPLGPQSRVVTTILPLHALWLVNFENLDSEGCIYEEVAWYRFISAQNSHIIKK